MAFETCWTHGVGSSARDNPQLADSPLLPDEEVCGVLVDVDAIGLFYHRDCPGDIVLPTRGLVVTMNKQIAIFDYDGTRMDVTHLVIVMMTPQYH